MSTNPILEGSTNSSFQRPLIKNEPIKSSLASEQKEKTKVTNVQPQCYKCKGFRHFAVVCLTRDKKLAYICKDLMLLEAMENVEEEEVYRNTNMEKEHLEAIDLPIHVIHRMLIRQKKEIDSSHKWGIKLVFFTLNWNMVVKLLIL